MSKRPRPWECTYCGHVLNAHRVKGPCRRRDCDCPIWRRQLELDPSDPRDSAWLAELAERELMG